MAVIFPDIPTEQWVTDFKSIFSQRSPWKDVVRQCIYENEVYKEQVDRDYIERAIEYIDSQAFISDDMALMYCAVTSDYGTISHPRIFLQFSPSTLQAPTQVYTDTNSYYIWTSDNVRKIVQKPHETNFTGLYYAFKINRNSDDTEDDFEFSQGTYSNNKYVSYLIEGMIGLYTGGVGTFSGITSSDRGLLFSNLGTSGTYVASDYPGKSSSSSGRYPNVPRGGAGSFDDSTDISDFPDLPEIDISDLGFIGLWRPSVEELKSFAEFVWNDPFNIKEWPDIIKSGVIKPLDSIASLNMLPVQIPDSYCMLQDQFVSGGIVFDGSDKVTRKIHMDRIVNQILDIDLGSIDLKEYWGSAMDYRPNTTVSLFLPYYGFVDLDTNDVMGSRLHLKYRVDLLNGTCTIMLKVSHDDMGGIGGNGSVRLGHVMYQWNTELKYEIGLTSGNNTEIFKTMATLIGNVATTVAML